MGRQQRVGTHEVALGGSRAAVLDLLRAADTPWSVQDVAARTGMHPNTARFHLEGLAGAGLAERHSEEREQPGRPRVLYRASASDADTGTRSYRLLAEMLTSLVANTLPDPAKAAVEAGRLWGAYLTSRPSPFEQVDTDEAIARLSRLLTDIGFGVEPPPAPRPSELLIRHCPFKEIAEHSQQVVCSLHLGIVQGSLAELRAPVAAERLESLVEPNLCHLHLTARRPAAGRDDDA